MSTMRSELGVAQKVPTIRSNNCNLINGGNMAQDNNKESVYYPFLDTLEFSCKVQEENDAQSNNMIDNTLNHRGDESYVQNNEDSGMLSSRALNER